MTKNGKGRGRPLGPGIDDMPIMRAMAELMATRPRLKATTAHKLVSNSWVEKDLRRVQIKWTRQGERLVADARSRRGTPVRSSTANREIVLTRSAHMHAKAQAAVQAHLGGKESLDTLASEMLAAHRALGVLDSTALKATRALFDSDTMRAVREFYDGPSARMARDMFNSPEMRMMREIQIAMPKSWLK